MKSRDGPTSALSEADKLRPDLMAADVAMSSCSDEFRLEGRGVSSWSGRALGVCEAVLSPVWLHARLKRFTEGESSDDATSGIAPVRLGAVSIILSPRIRETSYDAQRLLSASSLFTSCVRIIGWTVNVLMKAYELISENKKKTREAHELWQQSVF